MYNHITENNLILLGNPLPIEDEKIKVDWSNPSDFEFKYELGIAPNFSLELPGDINSQDINQKLTNL